MFDSDTGAAAAPPTRRDLPDALHRRLDAYADAGLLDRHTCDAICYELARLFELINGDLRDEAFWTAFRNAFGFALTDPQITPMNAANLCPEPTALLNCANLLRVAYNDNVSQQMRMAGGERVRQITEARRAIARSLGIADADALALVRNSSEGNNAITSGFRGWSPPGARKDTVVVWSENHPTNLEAWRLRRDWHSGERLPCDDTPRADDPFRLVVVDVPPDASESEIANAFISRIDATTRFVGYSETSNGSGFRIPENVMAAIWNHARRFPDCHVHVDGTMSWGARELDLSNHHCHSFVSSAHKWFLGPKETAILYVSADSAHRFQPAIFAYDYKIHIDRWDEMPDSALRFELLGQRDDVNLITLELTQAMWTALAHREPFDRVVQLASHLKAALVASGWTLVTPVDPDRSWGIVRIKAPSKPGSPSLYDWIYSDQSPHRFAGSGGGPIAAEQTFRLCPHIYNTLQDLDNAVDAMNAWREQHGA
jgi:selenocysteine lyase/cysteine desulfurase